VDWALEREGGCVPWYVIDSGVEWYNADRVNRELCARDLEN